MSANHWGSGVGGVGREGGSRLSATVTVRWAKWWSNSLFGSRTIQSCEIRLADIESENVVVCLPRSGPHPFDEDTAERFRGVKGECAVTQAAWEGVQEHLHAAIRKHRRAWNVLPMFRVGLEAGRARWTCSDWLLQCRSMTVGIYQLTANTVRYAV